MGDKKIIQDESYLNNGTVANSLRDAFANYDIGNTDQDDNYEVVQVDFTRKVQPSIPLEKQKDQPGHSNISCEITQSTFYCYVCSRKFPSEEKLRMHESMSALHKVKS